MTNGFFRPDIEQLIAISRQQSPASIDLVEQILSSTVPSSLEEIASIAKAMLISRDSAVEQLVLSRAGQLRKRLFGSSVVAMAPIEISNACASDCLFCGWRVSNRAMKRLRMPSDLIMAQVDYLISLGIAHIEFVSGDDFSVVRDLLPQVIRETKKRLVDAGLAGRVSFCSLALTENQYSELAEAGADAMIVWQETYDPVIFAQHIRSGPKAHGIDDHWKILSGGNGCEFRIESQERAMRAGLEVALGSMLGLNPDYIAELLAVVQHARYLQQHYGESLEHPMIIGMPIWNAITTPETDNRPRDGSLPDQRDLVSFFPAIAALYLLALPSQGTWVFPNCRVPLHAQVTAARVAGVFSSTEVKLGPGGYLPSIIRRAEMSGDDTTLMRKRLAAMLRESDEDVTAIAKALDAREQFVHHYHGHETYLREMKKAGLQVLKTARPELIPGLEGSLNC
jgi:2-iminoacetate synthase ThiH